jgi:molecular chaperone GrpE (heat shock protein)
MKLEIDVNIHFAQREAPRWANTLREMVSQVLANQETIMTAMDDLNAAVQRNTDAEASVITLLEGISQQLKDALAANDPAAIKAVIDKLDANTAAAAAAVVANTPAA